jgi:hypothetical protein
MFEEEEGWMVEEMNFAQEQKNEDLSSIHDPEIMLVDLEQKNEDLSSIHDPEIMLVDLEQEDEDLSSIHNQADQNIEVPSREEEKVASGLEAIGVCAPGLPYEGEETAYFRIEWKKPEIDDAMATCTGQVYQKKVRLWPPMPPFHYPHYDLILPKYEVIKMKNFIEQNPDGVFVFYVGASDQVQKFVEARGGKFYLVKPRPNVQKRGKGVPSMPKKNRKKKELKEEKKENTPVVLFKIKNE